MSRILTPLASLSQIDRTPSQYDGISKEMEEDLRAYGCKLIQQAGILLKQNQVAMATAQVLFQRFWYVTSMKQFGIGDVGMGALYLASKLEECPIRMRDLINVYDLLLTRAKHSTASHPSGAFNYEPMSYYSETYYDLKDALVVAEMQILKRLGFNVQVQLPFGTMVNYLQVLLLTAREDVAQHAWNYLNDALQTPVYALYHPSTIATACIFLTCRQLGISLPSETDQPWWELFDANLDDVTSICGYIRRLYRPRAQGERDLVTRLATKKELRKWLENRM